MSADNYVGVIKTKDGKYGVISYGNASQLDEDCQYRGQVDKYFNTRAEALVAAHNSCQEQFVVEYGVIELEEPGEFCGRCYICINERNIVASDIDRCDECGEPIHSSEWATTTAEGTFHHRCERVQNT